MPQRTANMALTVHREGKRIQVKAGQTFNFTAKEIEEFTAIDKDAVRKPINETIDDEELPTPKADPKPEVIDTKKSGKPLTAAEKKKQAAAEAAQSKAEEDGEAGDNDDDL